MNQNVNPNNVTTNKQIVIPITNAQSYNGMPIYRQNVFIPAQNNGFQTIKNMHGQQFNIITNCMAPHSNGQLLHVYHNGANVQPPPNGMVMTNNVPNPQMINGGVLNGQMPQQQKMPQVMNN